MDLNLPYEEKVKQVGDQVLKAYAEFEERKALRNLLPRVISEMPIGEGQLLPTSPISQLGQPLNSGMDFYMQCQGSQLASNMHNGVDFNNPGCFLPVLVNNQHELLEAYKQIECLRAQVSQTEVENRKMKQRNSELELENGLLNQLIMLSQLETLHPEQEFDTNMFLSMGHEEPLASDKVIRCGSFVDDF